jgi:uncharacterized protein YbjT (DUF2867 family)
MGLVFVAGASGYTGQAVVSALCDAGHQVVAHLRPLSSRLAHFQTLFGAKGATVDTTAWEPAAMTATMRLLAPELIFALLGTTRARSKADKKQGIESSYEIVDYGLSKLLMDAACAAEITPRFVYLSSMGAGGDPKGAYMAARAKSEKALIESGLPYTIARPSFITGNDRDESRTGERIGAASIDGLLAVVSLLGGRTLRERYRSTTGARLAASLVHFATSPEGENQILLSDRLQLHG